MFVFVVLLMMNIVFKFSVILRLSFDIFDVYTKGVRMHSSHKILVVMNIQLHYQQLL